MLFKVVLFLKAKRYKRIILWLFALLKWNNLARIVVLVANIKIEFILVLINLLASFITWKRDEKSNKSWLAFLKLFLVVIFGLAELITSLLISTFY